VDRDFKGTLPDSCGVVLFTVPFLPHAPWWVSLCWTLCSVTFAIALALARKRNQAEYYATVILIVMAFAILASVA
jgi:hypothetical protein